MSHTPQDRIARLKEITERQGHAAMWSNGTRSPQDGDDIAFLLAECARLAASLAEQEQRLGEVPHIQVDYSCMCSSPFIVGMEPWTQMRCPLHPDGRASRLRWGTGQRWTCFHCGETFATPGAAADHFGATPDRVAGCLIDRVALEEGGKPERGRGLLMALRQAEASLASQAQEIGQLRLERDSAREQFDID